jgi:hypothetical protein
VFDRFYRSLSARAVPGSGLGLAVVREIARGHSGTAEAEIAPDGGTLMRLTLPALPGRAGSPKLPSAVAATPAPARGGMSRRRGTRLVAGRQIPTSRIKEGNRLPGQK